VDRKVAKKIKTSVYLPDDLHWKFKEEVVKRRLRSDTAAMEAAIREWIEENPEAAASLSSATSRWHKMLAQILDSGDTEAIRATQQNLRVVFRAVSGSSELHLQPSTEEPKGKERKKQN
jgi:hypothetical protein